MHNDLERQNFLSEVEQENEKFEKFKAKFEELMMEQYGITINDCTDEEQLRVEFNTGSTEQEFVDFLSDKRDLTPINEKYF